MNRDFENDSNIDNQMNIGIPEADKKDDLQDFLDYPRNSIVENPLKEYKQNSNNQIFKKSNLLENENENSDEECGYSEYFKKNLVDDDEDTSFNLIKTYDSYKQTGDINYTNYKNYQNYQNYQNFSINNNNNYDMYQNLQEPEKDIEYNHNQGMSNYPMDSIVEDEDNNDNFENNEMKYDKKKVEELKKLCYKNGVPSNNDDYSPNGWTLFYPKTEKFFLWDKGNNTKKAVIINNEDDLNKLEIYEGEVNEKNERHGFGVLTTPKYVRKGTWREGEFTGWCREARKNGDILEGKFVDGALFGKGVHKNYKGNTYKGEFVDSKREGKGLLTNKRIKYEGDFKDNKLDGYGKIEFLEMGHKYEGQFQNNEINGRGKFQWKNGDIYEGEMKKGKMHGFGKHNYSNGQIYEGNYVDGVKEGKGKLIYPNNKIVEGEFKNGKIYGDATLFKNGKKSKIVFKDGKNENK